MFLAVVTFISIRKRKEFGLSPNKAIAKALGRDTRDSGLLLNQYIEWCCTEHPNDIIIIATKRNNTPRVGRHQKLRGDRQSNTGWCIIRSDDNPGVLFILLKEHIRAQ